ncbi:MAG: hypothetical protein ABSE44_10335 [Candidatus Sulfotelmatobacter sp.]
MKTKFATIVIAMLSVTFSQTGKPVTQNSLLDRARKGDDSAMSQMEKSGDVQDLQSLLHDPDYAGKISARLLLAKMGDHEALQCFACRGIMENTYNQLPNGLDYIGGGFTIELYRQLLDSDPKFITNIPKDNSSDELITLPSSLVLFTLPTLLPNAGIPSPPPLDVQARKDGEFKARWRTWIDSHQSELQKLKPTAEGISFEQHSCSDIYDPDAMKRRLQALSEHGGIDCQASAAGDADTVSNCIRTSFAKRRAFYVRQDLYGNVEVGLAGDSKGNVYAVAYDDAGVSTTGLGKEIELFDNKHTIVVPCPKPIHFRPSISWNGLTCLAQGDNRLLSPKM